MNHGQQPGIAGIPNMGISPSMMASSPQQQMMGQQQQQQMIGQQPQQNPGPMPAMPVQPQPTDNISKVKSLVGPLRESLSVSFKYKRLGVETIIAKGFL